MRTFVAGLLLLEAGLLAGCRGCDGGSRAVPPAARVVPTSVAFGRAKPGAPVSRALTVHADSRATLEVTGARLEDLSEPGAASAFSLAGVPLTVPALGSAELQVRFGPTAVRGYDARLLLETNDPAKPTVEVILVGEGATPQLVLTPVCDPPRGCRGSATQSPPALDFGAEVFNRQTPLPTNALPSVVLQNPSEVDLLVTALDLEGADAAAFSLATAVLKDSGPGGAPALVIPPAGAVEVPLRFTPTRADQAAFSAQLVVRSDAAETPEVRVALGGQLQPNLTPDVCANLTRAAQGGDVRDYASEAAWAPLRTPPPGGVYDFTASREVVPASKDPSGQLTLTRVTLSALSPGGDGACTRDPEEGRQGLRVQWTVLQAPPGTFAPRLLSPSEPETVVELGPQTGLYEVQLEVADPQGGPSVRRTLRFAAVPREDLVVQLTWDGAGGAFRDVDLDLHVVRPSTAARADLPAGPFAGAFAWFDESAEGVSGVLTSGDLNGRALTEARARPTTYGFDWGDPGTSVDDPQLPYDDTGAALQLEAVALDAPEADARCATEACRYKVLVHYFRDARPPGTPKTCNNPGAPAGCRDGARCECDEGFACVFAEAPDPGPETGQGKCYRAPQPVLRVFAKANPTPLAAIPLQEGALRLGAPCQMLYVADVVWPARGGGGEPRVEVQGLQGDGSLTPLLQRFGKRQGGGLDCLGNVTEPGATAGTWYDAVP